MNYLENMQQRYTTKMYDPSKKISADKIEDLKKILQLTPSSINSQPWQFTFVSDQKIKSELAKASFFNAQKILDCDILVVFNRMDSIENFENQIKEIDGKLDKLVNSFLDGLIEKNMYLKKKDEFLKQKVDLQEKEYTF